jgi:TetR/AcrR family transcriptional repressor of nem operon
MNKGERTKQHILEIASGLFNTKGISGTSVDEVVTKAHIARGCLYGHFENKEALALASVDFLLKAADDFRDAELNNCKSSYRKVLAIINMNLSPFNPLRASGCPIMNLGTEADDKDPRIKEKLRLNISENVRLIEKILSDGINAGEFSNNLIPAEFAVKMISTIKGAIVLSKISESDLYLKTALSALKAELTGFCQNRKG